MNFNDIRARFVEFALDPSKQKEFFLMLRAAGLSIAAGAAIWAALTGLHTPDANAVCCYSNYFCYCNECG